ncbi:MAG: hypothetical protein WCL06_07000, partial [Bacteroidota bacterium]
MKNFKFTLMAIIMAMCLFALNSSGQTVGGLGADYPTLKAAFDDINSGNNTGDIVLQLVDNTVESETAVLYESGHGGTSDYKSVTIYPMSSGLTISGFIVGPLINLNGADNVTIDGRVEQSGGKNLVITNSSHGDLQNKASTFLFTESAERNTIEYCIIKGSDISTVSGNIFFSTSTSGNGNDDNIIDNNDFTADDGDRPANAIYSVGTLDHENSGIIISNNNFFDCLSVGDLYTTCINLNNFTTSCTISGNSFYETTAFVLTGSFTRAIIFIQNAGVGFTITNNYIGGSAVSCGGTIWTKANISDNIFFGIYLETGYGTANSIQGNFIKNFAWSNSGSSAWTAIHIQAGDANIGTTTGNTIGASSGTGSITVTGNATGTNFYGININSTGTMDCENNNIGSITVSNASTNASNFFGVNKVVGAGTTTISNNTIGSTSTSNSINATSVCSGSYNQTVIGINSGGTGTITISNNTIANMTNGTTNSSTVRRGVVCGITSSDGTNTISNNTIYNLSIANANSAANPASVAGIQLTGVTQKTVTGNTIYNLSNTFATFAGYVFGTYFIGGSADNEFSGNKIYNLSATGATVGAANIIGLNYTSGTGANVVKSNFIYNLSVPNTTSATANIYGIKIASGATTYSNNIISLGGNAKNTIYGIYETGAASNNNNIYFNTVHIGGSLASGSTNKSYALYSAVTTNTRNIKNNILSNIRSTSGGANLHYAIYIVSAGGNIFCDNNDYYVSGTGSILGFYGANKTNLPVVTSQDVSSWAINPMYSNAAGTSATDYRIGEDLIGTNISGITVDYLATTRNNPSMGAFERPVNMWIGTISNNWSVSGNWTGNAVPLNNANIIFDANPVNHCQLDQDRNVTNITNAQSTYRMVTNGHKLTIRGILYLTNGAQIDASATNSTVDYNGTDQTILNPNGLSQGYYNLTLSGSGTKTMPATSLLVTSNFVLSGTVTASALSSITIGGNLNIGSGSAFITGTFNHSIAGNFTNNGTFSPTTGYTIILNGSAVQSITGTGTKTFANLTLNNNNPTNLSNVTINGILSIEGTSTVSTSAPTYGTDATLQYKGSAAQTTGVEFPSTFSANGGVIVNNTYGLTLGSSKTISNSLTLTTGALNINPTINLTVQGTTYLGNAQCLVIKSNSSASGSFIDNGFSGSGSAKVEKWVSSTNTGHWEYFSTPVASAYSSIFTTPSRGIWRVQETQNLWVSISNSSPQIMQNLLGYGRKYVTSEGDGNTIKNFIGVPNTGTKSVTVTRSENAQGSHHGWNLVGNPYPSAIDWDAATGWTKTNISNAIYARHDGTISTYIDGIYTGAVPMNSIIPPMTSFWVRVDTTYSTGSIACNNNVRVHSHSVTPQTPVNTLHLYIKNNESLLSDDSYIRFKNYATDGFDGLYDAQKFYPSDLLIPQIYTRVAGFEDIAINTFGTLDGYREIPLGFMTTVAGTFTITADMVSSFTSNGNHVYLRDNETNIIQDLSTDNTYEFSSGVTKNIDRFVILINSPIIAFPAINLNNSIITTFAGNSTIQLPFISTINNPDQYSINFDANANAAGLSDVLFSNLPSSQISVSIPTDIAPGTYNAILNVKISSTGAESIDYPISITVLTSFSTSMDIGTVLQLNWTATSGVSSYVIQYRLPSGSWIGAPAYSNYAKLSNLLPGTLYECRVTSFKNGVSSVSQIGSFTTSTEGFTTAYDIGTTLQISWTNFSWSSSYVFQYRKTGSANWIGIATNVNQVKINNLEPQTNYECKLTVFKNNVMYGVVQTNSFTTSLVEFIASNITSTSVALSWTDFNPWATSYTI